MWGPLRCGADCAEPQPAPADSGCSRLGVVSEPTAIGPYRFLLRIASILASVVAVMILLGSLGLGPRAILLVPVWAGLCLIAHRAWTVAIRRDSEGFVIRNVWSTVVVPVPDVRRAHLRAPLSAVLVRVVELELVDGRRVTVSALSLPGRRHEIDDLLGVTLSP